MLNRVYGGHYHCFPEGSGNLLITLFDYPEGISKAIYTTNAIEPLSSVIRKAKKRRKIFPTDASIMKMIYLAMEKASAKWTMPIGNWKAAMHRF